MVNPIYKWTLAANGGQETQVYPVYKDDLAKEYELQTNQEFYRAKLSGKLTFVAADYDYISSKSFDTKFGVNIYISYNGGISWSLYWSGAFWKTNCKFDQNNRNVTVTPEIVDRYTDVLAGMEKEYNLIDLAPAIVPVKLDKRPLIQVYVPGQTVIGCFLSGMWWEQECESVLETDTVHIGDDDVNKLTYLHFYKNKTMTIVEVSGTITPQLPDVFMSIVPDFNSYYIDKNGYRFAYSYDSGAGGSGERWSIIRTSDNTVLWTVYFANQPQHQIPYEVTLNPVSGSGATGTVTIYVHNIPVYARLISDTVGSGATQTYPIPDDDMVPNNRNYTRCVGYSDADAIIFTDKLSETPTPWGLYQPGKYYDQPSGSWYFGEFHPISRNAWGRVSIWYNFTSFSTYAETRFRQEYTLKDAYPLASVIAVLLAQIAPGLSHAETTAYSAFLYGTNPLLGITQRLFITPKSNMISLGYDQPAQKAPITLKRILDMLRDCFRCYWFVDDQNRFRIEHIEFFRRGGTYTGTPVIGRDLTVELDTRNGKPWAFGTSQFEFDKPVMAARYQFGWMDDVTQLFEGNPIDIVSKYVNPENIEQIEVTQFTSDIDYVLLNPGEISKDGFMLLAATLQSGAYKLPYIEFELGNAEYLLQNAYAAFIYLQQYYFYDMPAYTFKYNGVERTAYGVKKLKTQTLKFPAFNDPNTLQLIKTELGNGIIQKMSVNLSSRNANATLKYDTE